MSNWKEVELVVEWTVSLISEDFSPGPESEPHFMYHNKSSTQLPDKWVQRKK